MFDFVRKNTRIMQFLLFLLIFPSFVLFGLEGYNQMSDRGEAVAEVDGQKIRQPEWDAAHKNEVDRLRERMPNLDLKLFDTPEARQASLERIVRDRVLAAAAEKMHLGASDQQLARALREDPTIATLRKPDGTLDMERYRQLLGAQGMSPEMFEANVRADLSRRQVVAGVTNSAVAGKAVPDVALNAFFEKREVQVATFAASDYTAKVSVSDADVEAFYKDNARLFQAPEAADVEYLVLDIDSVRKQVAVSDADLRTYYEQNTARLASKEERRASHILINAPKSASADDRQKARAKAESLLAAVRKAPDSFAKVAKENSQDPGSAANGGDLDFFARGAMVKPFEEAAYALKKGEISDIVETEFGFHIIRVTDVKAPRQRSFDEMKGELETELRNQQAQRKFAEVAETFSNGVYEQSDSLKPTADKLKLSVQVAQGVQRKPVAGVAPVLANPKLLTALFSTDSIEKKRNTEAVELGPNQLASARIVQYTPARTRPFDEVRAQARQLLLAQRAAQMAAKEGADKLAAWKAAPAQAAVGAAVLVSRVDPGKLPRPVVDGVLRADASALPALVGIDLGSQGYAVARINKLVPREVPAEAAARQDRGQYLQAWADAEGAAYYDELKQRYKAEVKAAKPAPAAAAASK
jgi:peptidyl-prolyl cis-trans isomerase D